MIFFVTTVCFIIIIFYFIHWYHNSSIIEGNLVTTTNTAVDKGSLIDPQSNYIDGIYLNTFTGIIINLYNLLSIVLAIQFFSDTQSQVIIIIFNIIIYTSVYTKLLLKKIKKS